MSIIVEQLLAASDRLSERLAALPPCGDLVALDPTRYCRSAWAAYLALAARPGCVLVVGMNPGPHGMAQTGVPFTDPLIARELEMPLGPKPPTVLGPHNVGVWGYHGGWAAGRKIKREESAKRLWGLLREVCAPYAAAGPSADKIAEATRRVCKDVLLVNALPVCWLTPEGRNVSAEDVDRRARNLKLRAAAMEWLYSLIGVLEPASIVGVGAWSYSVAAEATTGADRSTHLEYINRVRHPSPLAGSEESWRAEARPVFERAVALSRAARGVQS